MMWSLKYGFRVVLFVSVFVVVHQAAILHDAKQEVQTFLRKLEALNVNDFEARQAPTCTIPIVEYGSFSCKTASGLATVTPGDGDVCELTCDAGLFLVDTINPVITCSILGTDARFDKTPSCKKYDVMHLASPSGDNQLNYSEAKALCGTKGARLATWAEMITAYRQGLELCSCGYIAAESAPGFGRPFAMRIMQEWSPECHSGGISICQGEDNFNAWCHM